MPPKTIGKFLFAFLLLTSAYLFLQRKSSLDKVQKRQERLEHELLAYSKQRKPDHSGKPIKGKKLPLKVDPLIALKRGRGLKENVKDQPIVSLNGIKLPARYRKVRGLFQFSGQGYAVLEELKALPLKDNNEDEFSQDQKIGIFKNHLIITRDSLGTHEESLPLVVNTRTQQLGIVTGLISVTFSQKRAYEEQENMQRRFINSFNDLHLKPTKEFSHLNLVFYHLDGHQGVEEVLAVEEWLKVQEGVAKARAEILEGGKLPH